MAEVKLKFADCGFVKKDELTPLKKAPQRESEKICAKADEKGTTRYYQYDALSQYIPKCPLDANGIPIGLDGNPTTTILKTSYSKEEGNIHGQFESLISLTPRLFNDLTNKGKIKGNELIHQLCRAKSSFGPSEGFQNTLKRILSPEFQSLPALLQKSKTQLEGGLGANLDQVAIKAIPADKISEYPTIRWVKFSEDQADNVKFLYALFASKYDRMNGDILRIGNTNEYLISATVVHYYAEDVMATLASMASNLNLTPEIRICAGTLHLRMKALFERVEAGIGSGSVRLLPVVLNPHNINLAQVSESLHDYVKVQWDKMTPYYMAKNDNSNYIRLKIPLTQADMKLIQSVLKSQDLQYGESYFISTALSLGGVWHSIGEYFGYENFRIRTTLQEGIYTVDIYQNLPWDGLLSKFDDLAEHSKDAVTLKRILELKDALESAQDAVSKRTHFRLILEGTFTGLGFAVGGWALLASGLHAIGEHTGNKIVQRLGILSGGAKITRGVKKLARRNRAVTLATTGLAVGSALYAFDVKAALVAGARGSVDTFIGITEPEYDEAGLVQAAQANQKTNDLQRLLDSIEAEPLVAGLCRFFPQLGSYTRDAKISANSTQLIRQFVEHKPEEGCEGFENVEFPQ